MSFYIGTDVGGTFTDLWIVSTDGRPRVFKSPTTKDVMSGVLDCVRLAATHYGLSFEDFCARIERFGHGTTVGLNALLTGNAAPTAIVTTAGFGDTLEIGRMKRQTAGVSEVEVSDWLQRDIHRPLVARSRIVEVVERIDANGTVIRPLDEAGARKAIGALRGTGIEAVAICTLWSPRNPAHEIALARIVREALPGAFVTLSHAISPSVGEYARMCTAAANAALGPIAGRYLAALEAALRKAGMRCPVLMMTSAGGVLPTSVLDDRPAFAVFSGPAAGVMGSQAIGAQLGIGNVLTLDIGGTSFDVGVIVDGRPMMRPTIALAGADLSVTSIDVASIGAGGGSLAGVRFGDLSVGPKSAGANPGPVCYGRGGTEPTSTDADLVLGVLDPDWFLGGRMKLDLAAARAAIEEKVARPLGLDVLSAAWGIREVLDNKMADLLRRVTVERGHDPRDFTMLANGGAGPSHAWALARELGLDGFVVPAAATAQSAFGTANADLGFTVTRPVYVRIGSGAAPTDEQLASVARAFDEAARQATDGLREAAASSVRIERSVALRYRGQTNHLDVLVEGDGLFDAAGWSAAIARYERDYEALFGRGAGFGRAGFELLSVRVIGRGALPPPATTAGGEPLVPAGTRTVVFDDPRAPVATRIYRTTFPEADATVDGPCIVEFPGQSVVIPPGGRARADRFGNLHVSLRA